MRIEEIEKIKKIMLKSDNWHDEESEERRLYEEMSCRSMIMACLIYDYNIYTNEHVKKYCDILGNQRVLELCNQQEEYFKKHIKVTKNIATDADGISYNGIKEY